jgi:hypothetical protein
MPIKINYPSFVSLVFALLTTFSGLAQDGQDGWVFKGEKNGVKTYFKKRPGVYEAKFVTSIHTSLSGFFKLMGEVEHYSDWGYKIVESRLLKRVSDTEIYYYSRVDFPWPLEDRDFIMHSKMVQDPITRRTESISEAAPDYIPEVAGVVRVRKANTRWVMIPGPGGWVYTEYYLDSDPGGSLPDWLVNMGLESGPREMFKTMRDILKRPEYSTAKLAHIKD